MGLFPSGCLRSLLLCPSWNMQTVQEIVKHHWLCKVPNQVKLSWFASKPSLIDRNECHLCLDHAVLFVLLLSGIRREEGSRKGAVAEQNKVNQGQSRRLNLQFPCLCWFKSDPPHCLMFCISFPQLLKEWLGPADCGQVGHARFK